MLVRGTPRFIPIERSTFALLQQDLHREKTLPCPLHLLRYTARRVFLREPGGILGLKICLAAKARDMSFGARQK